MELRSQERVHLGRSLPHHRGSHMAVDVRGDADLSVPEAFRDDFGMQAAGEQGGGAGLG